jgi:hypothetical protein
MICFVALPFAVVVTFFATRVRLPMWVAALAGPGLIFLFLRWSWVWIVLAPFVALRWKVLAPRWSALLSAIPTLVFGFGTVWNVNYLVLWLHKDRLHDPAMRDLDLWFHGVSEYRELFPLVRQGWLISAFEQSYYAMFAEMFIVILLWSRLDLSRFVKALFTFYAIGVLGFLIYPAVGPCIYFPESFRSDMHSSLTFKTMDAMYADYRTIRDGGTALSGLGYFIALPSLHVMVACLLQFYLHPSLALFWMFAPVNVMVSLSTIVLGYHYVLDMVVAVALAAVWIVLIEKPRGRTRMSHPIDHGEAST